MQCDICFRTGGSKLPFLCPIDARNQLYEPRIQNAQILLEKAALDEQITALLSPKTETGQELQNDPDGVSKRRLAVSQAASAKSRAIDRTQQIITQADELRAKVNSAREEITKRKATIGRRKSDLASASNGIEARRTRQVEDAEKNIRMTKFKWNQGHATTASSRAYLCGEAAKLYGLKRVRKPGGLEEYRIGGVTIMGLRGLNSANYSQISTVLSHIVHLLMLSTHYLAIRLPAEITLPHRDYPMPTIFPIASSYKFTDVPFPGTASGQSSSTSPTTSRHTEQTNQPRPRPLFINKPLPVLVTDDPAGHALFLEGVTLLAYDIAWACKSQGIPVGEDSGFDDICNIGRNLYNLLIGARPRPAPSSRPASTQATPTKVGKDPEAEPDDKKSFPTSIMGRYSHGTAHSFLGSAEGTEFIRSWKLLSPMKLVDKLKSKLLSEVATAEWEVLDSVAWTGEDEMGDDGVVVGANKEVERAPGTGMQSFMSVRTVLDAIDTIAGEGDRKQGVNGWTKLKPR